VAGIYFKLI